MDLCFGFAAIFGPIFRPSTVRYSSCYSEVPHFLFFFSFLSECTWRWQPFVAPEALQQAGLLQPLPQHAGGHGKEGIVLHPWVKKKTKLFTSEGNWFFVLVFQCVSSPSTSVACSEHLPRASPRTSSRRGRRRSCSTTGSRETRPESAQSARNKSKATTESRDYTVDGATSR